jgi:hypothetical protein
MSNNQCYPVQGGQLCIETISLTDAAGLNTTGFFSSSTNNIVATSNDDARNSYLSTLQQLGNAASRINNSGASTSSQGRSNALNMINSLLGDVSRLEAGSQSNANKIKQYNTIQQSLPDVLQLSLSQ